MDLIAILITVHNRKAKTLECLNHLFKQQNVDYNQIDVYVTDDGCTDGTVQAVANQYPSVHIVRGDGTLFWNRGMHLAWQAASQTKDYDFYLWLNDDTVLKSSSIATLLNTNKCVGNNAIIVGTTSSVKSEELLTYGGRNRYGVIIAPTSFPQICHHFNGNIVLIPRSVYRLVGFNDPFYHHALGDFDYGLRGQKLGVQSFVSPDILGYCENHTQLSRWCNPVLPLKQRWKAFRTPLGHNPEEFFIFEKRHNGISKALLHYVTNHIRVIAPLLWK